MQDGLSRALTDFASTPAAAQLTALGVAAAIGFLIGFEREWSHFSEAREKQIHSRTFAGARTFTLCATIGGLAGILDPSFLLITGGFVAVAVFVAVSY